MIRLVALSKRFASSDPRPTDRTVQALRDVSLEVSAGEYVTVVGPSGAGKSTLLRLIAGLDTPESGEVWIQGRSMAGVPPAAREVAMVWQDHPLFPQLNVEQNVGFPCRGGKGSAGESAARVTEALAMVGAEAWRSRAVTHLSGGERQRVALAMAWVRRPRILLLDEPLAQLDAPSREALRRELRALQRRQGLTVLHVTHDQAEAVALGDRVVVLVEGAIRQVAPPVSILQEPADLNVAQFFGGPGYQCLRGQLTGPSGARLFVEAGSGWIWKVPPAWEPGGCARGEAPRSGLDGRSVIAGFPAASLELAKATSENALGRGCVESREWSPEGDWLVLRLEGGPRLRVRSPSSGAFTDVGSEATATVTRGPVHWFDGRDGRRLA